MFERNPYSPPNTEVLQVSGVVFSKALTLCVVLPAAVAFGAFVLQAAARFPKGSTAGSITAAAVIFGLITVIFPTGVALAKLIRHRDLRRGRNIGITLVGAIFSAFGLLLIVAVIAEQR